MTDAINCPQCGKLGSTRDLPPSFLYCNEHLYFAVFPEMEPVVAVLNNQLKKELA
jgi:hypothetical protein